VEPVVGVLGPLELRDADTTVVRLGSARLRRLVAALALHAPAAVAAEVLLDLVWGADSLADRAGTLQTSVSRLRRALPSGIEVATQGRSYRLVTPHQGIDALVFVAHIGAAAHASSPTARIERLGAALALWRGRPYGELDHPVVDVEVVRLEQLHATAQEQLGAALLDAGRAGEAVAQLQAVVAAEPVREGAVGALMRALVAAGRPAEALGAFARLRAVLAEQLGLDPSAELQDVHERVLRGDLHPPPQPPPPTAGAAARVRLGVPVSSFVGRDGEVRRVAALLAVQRIVTLVGPGGVGKSRLAGHAAATIQDRYDDGVLVVDLSAARSESLAATVAAALLLVSPDPSRLVDRIVEVLAARRQLLLFDNCEHVADAVAALVEAVAAGTSFVDVLCTSREALRADGEHVVAVAPLPTGGAVALLTDRIRAADPSAVLPPGGELLEQICDRLDGLPLALELAAARMPALGLDGLLAALEEPLDALGRGRRTAAPRHRSLREVVEWSFRLLDTPQRELFTQVAVFAGAVEVSAITAVCGAAGPLPDLVDRSLVVRHDTAPVTYGMLETLRVFGRERLAADPDAAGLRARHTAWVATLVADTGAARCRPDEADALRRFDMHLTEVRRAHDHLCAVGGAEELLRMSLVLAELGFQQAREDLTQMADRAVAVVDPMKEAGTHPPLPRVLGMTAHSLWQRGDLDGAERRCETALEMARAQGKPESSRDALEALANVVVFRGELDSARELATRAHDLAEAVGDLPLLLMSHCDLTMWAAYAGDGHAAAEHERRAAALATALGSPTALAWAAYASGERRAESADSDAAVHLERAAELAGQAGATFVATLARHTLLTTTARAGHTEALPQFRALLDTWHGMGAWTQLWIAIRALIETLTRIDRHRDAATLLGALHAHPRAAAPSGTDADRLRHAEALARQHLNAEFDVLFARGAALDDSAVIAVARRAVS
jgi:predicted ATPase/DNA-binding SARP family transcriptional activator